MRKFEERSKIPNGGRHRDNDPVNDAGTRNYIATKEKGAVECAAREEHGEDRKGERGGGSEGERKMERAGEHNKCQNNDLAVARRPDGSLLIANEIFAANTHPQLSTPPKLEGQRFPGWPRLMCFLRRGDYSRGKWSGVARFYPSLGGNAAILSLSTFLGTMGHSRRIVMRTVSGTIDDR